MWRCENDSRVAVSRSRRLRGKQAGPIAMPPPEPPVEIKIFFNFSIALSRSRSQQNAVRKLSVAELTLSALGPEGCLVKPDTRAHFCDFPITRTNHKPPYVYGLGSMSTCSCNYGHGAGSLNTCSWSRLLLQSAASAYAHGAGSMNIRWTE